MSNGFLSKEQLVTFTGWKHRSKQIQELVKEGIPHKINAKGEIVVSWANVNKQETSIYSEEPAWSN